MNFVEKILAAHCGRKMVKPGEIIQAKVDLVLGNELSTIVAIQEFEKAIELNPSFKDKLQSLLKVIRLKLYFNL